MKKKMENKNIPELNCVFAALKFPLFSDMFIQNISYHAVLQIQNNVSGGEIIICLKLGIWRGFIQ